MFQPLSCCEQCHATYIRNDEFSNTCHSIFIQTASSRINAMIHALAFRHVHSMYNVSGLLNTRAYLLKNSEYSWLPQCNWHQVCTISFAVASRCTSSHSFVFLMAWQQALSTNGLSSSSSRPKVCMTRNKLGCQAKEKSVEENVEQLLGHQQKRFT